MVCLLGVRMPRLIWSLVDRIWDMRWRFFSNGMSQIILLTLSMLGKNFSRRQIDDVFFFLFSPENRACYSMQIASWRDNLHEMSKPIFWRKKLEKQHQFVVCWFRPELPRRQLNWWICYFWAENRIWHFTRIASFDSRQSVCSIKPYFLVKKK